MKTKHKSIWGYRLPLEGILAMIIYNDFQLRLSHIRHRSHGPIRKNQLKKYYVSVAASVNSFSHCTDLKTFHEGAKTAYC